MKNATERNGFIFCDGVWLQKTLSTKHTAFAKNYRQLREQEGRSLSVKQIRRLPDYEPRDTSHREWQIRKRSVNRFLDYLKSKKEPLRILEVGCGNGFLSHLMASEGNMVCGVDVAMDELQMAVKAFGHTNITWYCADILSTNLPEEPFDMIVFSASLQYFPEPDKAIRRCKNILTAMGEIHVFDTPFYREEEKSAARLRSETHFNQKNVPGFSAFYFHHTLETLGIESGKMQIIRSGFLSRITGRQIPFPWLIIK